jgi:hypothetical protein
MIFKQFALKGKRDDAVRVTYIYIVRDLFIYHQQSDFIEMSIHFKVQKYKFLHFS